MHYYKQPILIRDSDQYLSMLIARMKRVINCQGQRIFEGRTCLIKGNAMNFDILVCLCRIPFERKHFSPFILMTNYNLLAAYCVSFSNMLNVAVAIYDSGELISTTISLAVKIYKYLNIIYFSLPELKGCTH